MVRLHEFNGCAMYVNDELEVHQFYIGNGLNYEIHVRRELERVLPSAKVMWDIGANAGLHTVSAMQINPSLSVYCFEPAPANLECLLRTIEHNGWNWSVFVIPVALAEANTIIGMNGCPDDPTCGEKGEEHPLLVPAMSLDSFDIPLPDVVKIDIEGFEHRALSGAKRLMQRKPVIISEYNIRLLENNWGAERYLEFLRSHGYNIRMLIPIKNRISDLIAEP